MSQNLLREINATLSRLIATLHDDRNDDREWHQVIAGVELAAS